MLNSFDVSIVSFFNQFAHRSWTLDETLEFVCFSDLLKGGVVIPLLWWAWFTRDGDQSRRRQIVLSTILASLVALFIARALAVTLPYRPRPSHIPELGFLTPYSVTAVRLKGWSSFPSDHASLFVALAIGLISISQPLGMAVLAYVIAVICLPRIYVGLHFPTDIIAGAIIGGSTTYFINRSSKLKRFIDRRMLVWPERSPAAFYTCFFIVTHQFCTLFQETRALGNFGLGIIQGMSRVLSDGI